MDSRASAPWAEGAAPASVRVPAQEAPAKKRKGNEGAVDSGLMKLPPEIRKKIEMGVPDTVVGRSAFGPTLRGIALDPSSWTSRTRSTDRSRCRRTYFG